VSGTNDASWIVFFAAPMGLIHSSLYSLTPPYALPNRSQTRIYQRYLAFYQLVIHMREQKAGFKPEEPSDKFAGDTCDALTTDL
jgi:hypothetical protein